SVGLSPCQPPRLTLSLSRCRWLALSACRPMSERHFAPGSLLAERFRVVAERVSDSARVVDARDELSAGGRTVRLLLVRATVTARDLEAAVRRTLRYAV